MSRVVDLTKVVKLGSKTGAGKRFDYAKIRVELVKLCEGGKKGVDRNAIRGVMEKYASRGGQIWGPQIAQTIERMAKDLDVTVDVEALPYLYVFKEK